MSLNIPRILQLNYAARHKIFTQSDHKQLSKISTKKAEDYNWETDKWLEEISQ